MFTNDEIQVLTKLDENLHICNDFKAYKKKREARTNTPESNKLDEQLNILQEQIRTLVE